jgi:hypothetical protein
MRSLEGATAQYLLRSCSLDMFTALHRLSDWPSVARLLALRDTAIRTPYLSQTMPSWYVASSWIDVRINSLCVDSLGPCIQRLGQNPRPEELVPLLVELVTRQAPALSGLRLDDSQYVQDELAATLGMPLPALFESRAPPECIEVLGERGLRKLLTPQTAGGPTAHASA